MDGAVDRAIDQALARGEVGVQVAAYRKGELVIDTFGGDVRAGKRAVDSDTIFWVASAGKVSTATALHLQVERGKLSYDQTVASLWPEFGTHGKEAFTVRDALTHRVGLADLPSDATPELIGDWQWMTDRLANTPPTADEEYRNSYHPRTWGFIVGEIIRRSDPSGRSFEEFVREEVHTPLGITEFWHRLPTSVQDRAAIMKGDILCGENPFPFTVTEDDEINTPAYRDRTDPSGAWMTARAGARLWAMYAQSGQLDGVRLLSSERVQSFFEPRPGGFAAGLLAGPRAVIGQGGLWLGGQVPSHSEVLGFGNRVLFHLGAGGALGFADLDAELSGMICHNEFFDERSLPAHPFAPIVRAIYADAGV